MLSESLSDLNSKQFSPSALSGRLNIAAGLIRNRRGAILGNASTRPFTKAYLPVLKLQLAIFQMSAALISCSQVVQFPISTWFHSTLIIGLVVCSCNFCVSVFCVAVSCYWVIACCSISNKCLRWFSQAQSFKIKNIALLSYLITVNIPQKLFSAWEALLYGHQEELLAVLLC